jgi:molybdenum cofactor cytidylyltransferase
MIAAIIPAAGRSMRMGRPKMLLPWGDATVLEQVIQTVHDAGIQDILVITGSARNEVEQIAARCRVRTTYNENFESEEMLASIQYGLRAQQASTEAVLICLGDQPQVQEESVRSVCAAFDKNRSSIVVPSYRMRRGHPWLVARPLWDELLKLQPPNSPRDFLNAHASGIEYVLLDSPSIIEDLDTPEDYLKFKPPV